jgi:hypothetical protein
LPEHCEPTIYKYRLLCIFTFLVSIELTKIITNV